MLITFEGPEGAGKSTALASVVAALNGEGRPVIATREPGAGALGMGIRKLLLETSVGIGPRAELFLFLADRSEHVATVIGPALRAGKLVLCDRFVDSTVVYQGHARGLDVDTLRELNLYATEGLMPGLTLLFDLPVEVGLERLPGRDRLDSEPIEFHRRVREGFLAEASREPSRWRVVDASRSPEEVAAQALSLIRSAL